ncbi:RagB/SusD family nutrient uptake outer membrane protein [Flavobacterium sp. RSP29]|uniref:RagB/SusD family nutrient uptake outer membrane protein n=1 Tax=Flavobacterium sp. RSP29 TaxID=3401731 RepID=UPI003AAD3D58
MKLRNIKQSFLLLVVLVAASACSEDFLNVDPEGTALEEAYYSNEFEAYSGLVSVYDGIGKYSVGFENMVTILNAGSDDTYAGGGGATDGTGIQSFSNYTISSVTIPTSYWNNFYQGIFRANVLLVKLPEVPMDETVKARFTAESKALRAFYYFELVRLFKNIPLITVPLTPNEIASVTQVSPELIYAQIEKDLTESMPDLPMKITNPADEAGRLTKGAVQALLGKVYLYQGKNTLAATQFAQVNGTPGTTSQYGYKLLDNYADLWVVANKFNTESILEVSNTNRGNTGWGNWGSGSDEGNSVNVMIGPRSYSRPSGSAAPDYATGFAFNPITQNLYDVIKTDPRFKSTVADLKALKAAGLADYIPGYQDTGFFIKKFMPLTADITTGGGDAVLNYRQNMYVIRLADTYLMEAEALGGTGVRAQALLDAVRARVGLTPVAVSIDAIIAERRIELACEGHRWYDLVRTGRAASVLANRGFVAGKNEIWPIPLKELENTQIVQNPNYN